jgi:hypothetical protein
VAVIGFAVALASPAVPAQTDSDMEILRDKLKADKKLLVAENLRLTEDEAKGFWPIYDAHQQKLDELNERLGRTIESYADAYVDMTLTDEKAKSLMEAALEVEQAEVALKKETLKKLDGVVPAMKAVRYLQLENKIRALIRFDLAANIPLVE